MTIILSEYLQIGTVHLGRPNCKTEDVAQLQSWRARYESALIPGMVGRLETEAIQDEIVDTVLVKLRGDVDEDGVPIADPIAGMKALIASLRSSVTGSRAATLHLGADTSTAQIVVDRFDPVRTGPLTATLLLRVTVPAGGFT